MPSGVAYHAQRLGLRAVIVMPRLRWCGRRERTRLRWWCRMAAHWPRREPIAHQAGGRSSNRTFIHPFGDDECDCRGPAAPCWRCWKIPAGTARCLGCADRLPIDGGGGLIAGHRYPAAGATKPEMEVVGRARRSAFPPWCQRTAPTPICPRGLRDDRYVSRALPRLRARHHRL